MIDRRGGPKLRPATFENDEDMERMRRLEERFRYDDDDVPAVGPGGPDEHDRKLIDESQPR